VSKLQPETVKSLISSDQSQHSIDLIAQMLNALSGQSGDHAGRSPTADDSTGNNAFGSPTDLKRCITDPWLSSHSPPVAPASGPFVCGAEASPSAGSDQSKAPGNNRPKKSINSSFYQDESDFTDFDYEQMRVKAFRGTLYVARLFTYNVRPLRCVGRFQFLQILFASRICASGPRRPFSNYAGCETDEREAAGTVSNRSWTWLVDALDGLTAACWPPRLYFALLS
jgi:hypothetical protein